MYCECGSKIDPERLAALPSTRTCFACSTVSKHQGMMVFDGKTGGECVIIEKEDAEAKRLADRANRRGR